jgi:phosphoserine phosphatase RsbU/P
LNILVAEDDPGSRMLLEAVLRGLGHRARLTPDGRAAWTAFLEQQPDVLIADWMMPTIDGLELTRLVRGQRGRTYTYVILLTALHGKEFLLEGMRAGADDYLTKPLDEDELAARLEVARRILALQERVERLEGLLPICSYCKRIRDEHESWLPIDEYLVRRTDARFTHGLCPECRTTHVQPILDQARARTANDPSRP